MFSQIIYFKKDLIRMLGKHKIRILHIWLSRVFWGILLYRLERSFYLLFGKNYGLFRVPFIPILNIIQWYSNLEIHYKADIKGGLLVLHPSVGVVISGLSIIGENFTLVGGNIVGAKAGCKSGEFIIGNNCTVGANATIIGPVKIGNNIEIGASACVISNFLEADQILVGVPAKNLSIK
jgi:serine O-acetyltransferase